jgi:predicted TIM-barrel fold metal-dependent hydrolase
MTESLPALPPGTVDTHMHIYGPASEFPYPPGAKVPGEYPFSAYVALRKRLGIAKTVYVQPSAYGRDHACMLDALRRDPGARAVADIGPDISDTELQDLHEAGVRAARIYDQGDGSTPFAELEAIVARLQGAVDWHVILQPKRPAWEDLTSRLNALPGEFVIDHMGRIPVEKGTDDPGFKMMIALARDGRAWIKLSAPYHVSKSGAPGYDDCRARAEMLIEKCPDRLLWGTNWPHPNAVPPDNDDDQLLRTISGWIGDGIERQKIFVDNPHRLYGFEQ